MPKGPYAVLSSPFRMQSADVQQHILKNCAWVLFHDGSAAIKDGGLWRVLLGACSFGGEAEAFVWEMRNDHASGLSRAQAG